MAKDLYDVLIIGGGISASVFASNYVKNNFNTRIAIIEAGRGLGGRSSTRFSSRFIGWKLNHGSPNFNICNIKKNKNLSNFINELLDENIIKFDDSDLIILNKENKLNLSNNFDFSKGNVFLSSSSMSELSSNIIKLNNLRNQIDFYFNTLIFSLEFNKDHWILLSKNGKKFKSNYLVCSSNLILHNRSKEIFNINQIPLRSSIPEKKNKNIDSILNIINNQKYIPRLSFLIYTHPNYKYKDQYTKNFRYFILNNYLENKYKFERIIFQYQLDRSLGIVIHTKNKELINSYLNNNKEDELKKEILLKFNQLFKDSPYINYLSVYKDISIMRWRASQPLGVGVPESLQFCKAYQIGFCGDWFAEEGFGRIEGAILSSLKLSNKFKF